MWGRIVSWAPVFNRRWGGHGKPAKGGLKTRKFQTCPTLALVFVALHAQDLPPQDAPKDVLDFFRTAAEALADKDAMAFLDHFDTKMTGYDVLSSQVQALLERSEVSSSIEVVEDQGTDQKRTLQLDWLLRIDMDLPKRQIVKCSIEKQSRKWKITSFDPIDLFK
jgi:hypothetical protein